jgi:hypothetical protein
MSYPLQFDNITSQDINVAEEKVSNQPDTHWLHLADGEVIKSKGVASHVGGVPVIGAYEIPVELQEGYAESQKEAEHQF